ncbi:MAG: DUF2007 domain-containing protein [Ruminococcaceae bacterium]|jgi:hypothetical protein|nr:DUF2007 domain-containing protein [Oscillospiraceae bacterium]
MFGEFGRNMPGKLYRQWPRDARGEIVPPKFLTHCSSRDVEDEMLVAFLKSYGIPAVVLHPGDGSFGKVVLGLSGTGSSIYVPETMYDMAKELMEATPDDDLQSGI